MCGIAGIAVPFGWTIDDLALRLNQMTDAMIHRGPDDSGSFVCDSGRVGLANRRLAVRDLSPLGHMPMRNVDGTIWLTYNGEVYNADELRADLESQGRVFLGASDTEVVLHAYEAWGEQVVDHLRGMFAFAICDRRAASGPLVFLARDRLGIKPLYYAELRGSLVFASELKGLVASGLVTSELSPTALLGYLLLGSVPAPMTIYEAVRALEPGCTLKWEGGRITTRRYWDLPRGTVQGLERKDALEMVGDLLRQSVRESLVSDVPLGAFLSGGLDSSAVVALMRQATAGTIRTCSMVFEEDEYSEARYARAVADTVGAEHFERVITGSDVVKELDRLFWAMDQPTVDGVNSYFVSQTARQAGLTVALSGLGGDELFGGYPNTFRQARTIHSYLERLGPVPGASGMARVAASLMPDGQRWIKVVEALDRHPSRASAYFTRRGLFSLGEAKALLSPGVWHEAVQQFDPLQYIAGRADGEADSDDWFAWVSRAELHTYTHNQLLRDTDVMSMAHSLEVRVPLLDHRLVEAVLSVPERFKQDKGRIKPLMIDALGELMPAEIRDRKTKQGFTFPFERWLRGPLSSLIQRALFEAPSQEECFKQNALRGLWSSYLSGKVHWSRPWALAVIPLWRAASAQIRR